MEPLRSDSIPHYVYEWVDPRDMSIFYVGITVDLYERYKQHMRCDGINPQKDLRIQEILASGHLPIMRTIEHLPTFEEAAKRERYWIQDYMSRGVCLLNIIGVSKDSGQKRVKKTRETSEPQIQRFLDPWDIADLPIWKRNNRVVTAEYATDAEFQSWVEWNGIPLEREFPNWLFDYRCYIVNFALTQGLTLQFADGTYIPSEDGPPDSAA